MYPLGLGSPTLQFDHFVNNSIQNEQVIFRNMYRNAYVHLTTIKDKKKPSVWSRARKNIGESLEWGDRRHKWCDYIIILKIKEIKTVPHAKSISYIHCVDKWVQIMWEDWLCNSVSRFPFLFFSATFSVSGTVSGTTGSRAVTAAHAFSWDTFFQ